MTAKGGCSHSPQTAGAAQQCLHHLSRYSNESRGTVCARSLADEPQACAPCSPRRRQRWLSSPLLSHLYITHRQKKRLNVNL